MASIGERRKRGTAQLCAALLLSSAGLSAAQAGQLALLSKTFTTREATDTASGESEPKAISADGRYVLFLSNAPNLVPGQIDENDGDDLFLRDRIAGTTILVTRTAASPVTTGPLAHIRSATLSADGRYVAFDDGNIFLSIASRAPLPSSPRYRRFSSRRPAGIVPPASQHSRLQRHDENDPHLHSLVRHILDDLAGQGDVVVVEHVNKR